MKEAYPCSIRKVGTLEELVERNEEYKELEMRNWKLEMQVCVTYVTLIFEILGVSG
jgi:hypothetical protein